MRKTEVENKKAPRGGDKYNIKTMAKLLQKLFSCNRKPKKVQDTELQVIDGYLCYNKRRYSELTNKQKEAYSDCLALHSLQEILRESQLRYVLR